MKKNTEDLKISITIMATVVSFFFFTMASDTLAQLVETDVTLSSTTPEHQKIYKGQADVQLTLITKGMQTTDGYILDETLLANYGGVGAFASCVKYYNGKVVEDVTNYGRIVWPSKKGNLVCNKGEGLHLRLFFPDNQYSDKYTYSATLIANQDSELNSE